jgi:endonuclease/exonuclease/phosphatase family metal-dependent hydrolase
MGPTEMMQYFQACQSEQVLEDPWEELLKLAMHDPYVRRTVDMVQHRGMSIGDACTHLALYQTRRAMELQKMATDWLRVNPAPFIVMGSGEADAQHKAG